MASSSRGPWVRLLALLALFLGLSVAGVWWSAPSGEVLRSSWGQLLALPTSTHLLCVAFALALIAAEAVRFAVIGRVLGVRVSPRTALDAAVANNFFSWISPGATLGHPASIYMLGRGGVPWGAALVISFGKFASGFLFIMGLSCLLVACGLGPRVPLWAVVPFLGATGFGLLVVLALVAGAFWPDRVQALIGRAEGWGTRRFSGGRARSAIAAAAEGARGAVGNLVDFRKAGAAGSLAVLATQLVYYAAFVGVLMTLGAGLGAPSLSRLLPVAVIYQGFLYISPTPGASGIGEAAADLFFGALVPGGRAFLMVLVFRTLTFTLQVAIGLVYLPLVGGLRGVLVGSRER